MFAHVPTMLLMSLFVSCVMALAVLLVALGQKSCDCVRWWGAGLLLNTISDGLFVIASKDPSPWLLVAGYVTLTVAVAAALQAVLAFFSWRLNRVWLWLPPTLLSALSIAFANDALWSVLLLEPILVVQLSLVGWAALRGCHSERACRRERGRMILALGMGVAVFAYSERIVLAAFGAMVSVDLISSDGWQTLFYLQANASLLFATFGLVLMHKEHAEAMAFHANERLVEVERERARLDERRRLLEDVHDGFGSQLATARLRVLHRDLNHQQLEELLCECLDDLYLVIDTLNSPDTSLENALIDYQHRMRKRLTRLPIDIKWQIDLDACPPLGERVILQVMRILQEALANALKHAQATSIVIDARCRAGDAVPQVVVADDGAGMPPSVVRGRGLDNMRGRARAIGAELRWEGNSPGTRVLLEVPLNGD